MADVQTLTRQLLHSSFPTNMLYVVHVYLERPSRTFLSRAVGGGIKSPTLGSASQDGWEKIKNEGIKARSISFLQGTRISGQQLVQFEATCFHIWLFLLGLQFWDHCCFAKSNPNTFLCLLRVTPFRGQLRTTMIFGGSAPFWRMSMAALRCSVK